MPNFNNKADIIYVIGKDFDLRALGIYRNLFDNSGLNCRQIFIDSIGGYKESLSHGFQYHAPHTRIYVLMNGAISETGHFLLSLDGRDAINASELMNEINRIAVHPIQIGFISLHSGMLLQESIIDDFGLCSKSEVQQGAILLKRGSTITVSNSLPIIGSALVPRIENEVKELKDFLKNEDCSVQELIEKFVIRGVLSSPEDLQFLRMTDVGPQYLNITALSEFLSEKELLSHLIEQVRKILVFFGNAAPAPLSKDITSFFLKPRLKIFLNHLFFTHLERFLILNSTGSISYIRTYLAQGEDPNIRSLLPTIQDATPVILASLQKNLECLKIFIAYGGNIHAVTSQGATAFYLAILNQNREIIEYCLSLDVNVNQMRRSGQTPLYVAAALGSDAIVELLCRNGADPNIGGHIPLIEAAKNGYDNIVQKLLECGADLHKKNKDGHTALSLAKTSKIKHLLLDAQRRQKAFSDCYSNLFLPVFLSVEEINTQLGKSLIEQVKIEARKKGISLYLHPAADLEETKTLLIRRYSFPEDAKFNMVKGSSKNNILARITIRNSYLTYFNNRSECNTELLSTETPSEHGSTESFVTESLEQELLSNSELKQKSKYVNNDRVDVIYIVAEDLEKNILNPYVHLFAQSGLNCRRISFGSLNMPVIRGQFLEIFQYHAPHTRIYVFMHATISDKTGRLLLHYGLKDFTEATTFINWINMFTMHPIHISLITCYSGAILQASTKYNFWSQYKPERGVDTIFLRDGSTITVSNSDVSFGPVFVSRIEYEIDELKNFLKDETYDIKKLIRNFVIGGTLSSPTELQFLMMMKDGVKRLKVPVVTDVLSKEELLGYLIAQTRQILTFFNNTAPLPRNVFKYFLDFKLKSFNNTLFFVHHLGAMNSKSKDRLKYINRVYRSNLNIRTSLPDIEGYTPIISASEYNDSECVKTLISHGANIHPVTNMGFTVLYFAAKNGNVGLIEYCLSLQVDVNQKDPDGQTPLYIATGVARSIASVRLLLQHGADPNIPDYSGRTPLMQASKNGDYKIVEELIKYSADLDRENNFGHTALSFAKTSEIKHFLRNAQEKQSAMKECYNALFPSVFLPIEEMKVKILECDKEILPEKLLGDSPEDCYIEPLGAENPIESNRASLSLSAGAKVGFWQGSKSDALKITCDNQDKSEPEAQAEIEPRLKSNFDGQLMLGAVGVRIVVDFIAWGIGWLYGETKKPVEEYISEEKKVLFIKSSQSQLEELRDQLPKLPHHSFPIFLSRLDEIQDDLNDFKKQDSIKTSELIEFEEDIAEFEKHFKQERSIRQAASKEFYHESLERQSGQGFFQPKSQPLLLGNGHVCPTRSANLPNVAPSYRAMSNVSL